MTDILRAYAWYSGHGRHGRIDAEPPRAAILQMLAEIETKLNAARVQPVSLLCQRWPASAFEEDARGGDYLACITITVEPGELVRRLTSWFAWQHPNWQRVSPPQRLAGPVIDLVQL